MPEKHHELNHVYDKMRYQKEYIVLNNCSDYSF